MFSDCGWQGPVYLCARDRGDGGEREDFCVHSTSVCVSDLSFSLCTIVYFLTISRKRHLGPGRPRGSQEGRSASKAPNQEGSSLGPAFTLSCRAGPEPHQLFSALSTLLSIGETPRSRRYLSSSSGPCPWEIPEFSFLFLIFFGGHTQRCSGVASGSASGVTIGGAQGTYGMLGIEPRLATWELNALPAILSFQPLPRETSMCRGRYSPQ